MTREEEINKEWMNYSVQSNHQYDKKSFIEGAKWADKTMLEKACNWLNNIDIHDFEDLECDGNYYFCYGQFIEKFKKAMEG